MRKWHKSRNLWKQNVEGTKPEKIEAMKDGKKYYIESTATKLLGQFQGKVRLIICITPEARGVKWKYGTS